MKSDPFSYHIQKFNMDQWQNLRPEMMKTLQEKHGGNTSRHQGRQLFLVKSPKTQTAKATR